MSGHLLMRLLLLGLVLLLVHTAMAQRSSYQRDEGPVLQSLSLGYYAIDFAYDGKATPLFSFDFSAPAYGLIYARPNFLVTAALGTQEADEDHEALLLTDVTLETWGTLFIPQLGNGAPRIYIPVILSSAYRRVAPREDSDTLLDAFNVTVLGLGTGLGLHQPLGEETLLTARAYPVLGIASSSFTDAFGSARMLKADIDLQVGSLMNRFGLGIGYSFKTQVWNVNASNIFPDVTDELFDYAGTQHMIRIGVTW